MVEVPATDLAVDLGNIMTASMVMLGAYVAATGIVGARRRSTRAVDESLPSVPHAARGAATSPRSAPASSVAPARASSPAWERGGAHDAPCSTRGTVVIDVEACKGCDLCIDACPPRVLAMTVHDVNTAATATRGC